MNVTSSAHSESHPPSLLLHAHHARYTPEMDSSYYFDMWTLLASLGLLVIVVLINAVVFMSWRRQFHRETHSGLADLRDNHFYFPSTPGSISIIDVGMVDQASTGSIKLLSAPFVSVGDTMSGAVNEMGMLKNKCALPIRQVIEWSPHGIDRNRHDENKKTENAEKGVLE